MVDFDAAAAAVQDPNADPVFLAKIAYENPEFGANVVANPRAYPGLKRWVAQFGDERARQQLVAMGWPVPQNGVQPHLIAEPTAQPMAETGCRNGSSRSSSIQPAVAEQYPAGAAVSAGTAGEPAIRSGRCLCGVQRGFDRVCRPIHESRPICPKRPIIHRASRRTSRNEQYAEQEYAAAQESPADAGSTAELAMTTHRSRC